MPLTPEAPYPNALNLIRCSKSSVSDHPVKRETDFTVWLVLVYKQYLHTIRARHQDDLRVLTNPCMLKKNYSACSRWTIYIECLAYRDLP